MLRHHLAAVATLGLLAGACAAPPARGTAGPTAEPPTAAAVAGPTAAPPPPDPTRPPQFVAVSFDGAGDAGLWRYWRAVGRRAHAHLTFFLSGVYLLSGAGASLYHPPRRPAGSSAIGFVEAPPGVTDRAYIGRLLDQIAAGRAEGHELATHFNGHFCGPRGVASWTAADWGTELDAFDSLLEGALDHNGLGPGEAAPPPPVASIVGERTPCLEGDLRALHPVLRARGFRYDASRSAPRGDWPVREQGIWSLPLSIVERAGTSQRNVAMDYSFYVNQSGAVEASAAAAPALEEQTYQSYLGAFRTSYLGDRAPLNIGHHFTTWNHGAYLRALTRLLDDVCRLPEVRCVSLVELADWMDANANVPLHQNIRSHCNHHAHTANTRPHSAARPHCHTGRGNSATPCQQHMRRTSARHRAPGVRANRRRSGTRRAARSRHRCADPARGDQCAPRRGCASAVGGVAGRHQPEAAGLQRAVGGGADARRDRHFR